MDTSKEYIEQCDCPEIQEQWGYRKTIKPNIHDFVHREEAKYTFGREVFLPRQDQIQEMLGDMGKCYEIFYELVLFDQRNLGQEANSMEQLWLIVYMWEKHKKIWTGKKWKNE